MSWTEQEQADRFSTAFWAGLELLKLRGVDVEGSPLLSETGRWPSSVYFRLGNEDVMRIDAALPERSADDLEELALAATGFLLTGSTESRAVSWAPDRVNNPFRNATASADRVADGVWWVSRVLVSSPDDRCKGLGSELLRLLRRDCSRQPGFVRMIVTPGGYGSDPVRLRSFYERAGFTSDPESEWQLQWRQS